MTFPGNRTLTLHWIDYVKKTVTRSFAARKKKIPVIFIVFTMTGYMTMRCLTVLTLFCLLQCSCASIPQKAEAVHPFDKTKYLGKWYEIARKDFKFEKNLNNTTAEYTAGKKGRIIVDNKGYNYRKNEWKESIGKAKFRKADTIARLKVSFCGPFYTGYNVIAIDKDYQYALVAGRNLDYLWILSRSTGIPEDIKKEYLLIAQKAGYNTDDLVWVTHDKAQ